MISGTFKIFLFTGAIFERIFPPGGKSWDLTDSCFPYTFGPIFIPPIHFRSNSSFFLNQFLANSVLATVPIRKTRFFSAHFMKLPVAPMISKIHKQYVPHLKDLKLSFKLRYQTFQKSSRLKFFRLNFKS